MEAYVPIKALGQHFLVNKNIQERIAALLEARDTDNILEIGPGQGALSRLLKAGPHKNLVLLERDRRFAKLLSSFLSPGELVFMDALSFNWNKLRQNWKIIGNLPYNIASPLIWDILSRCSGLQKAVFMIQQEVGERITAKPGTRHYGALSVWCQCHSIPKMEIKVAPGNFSPPPKVNSVILSFLPVEREQKPQNPEKLKKLLSVFFQQRRKQLGTILKKSPFPFIAEVLEEKGISLKARPETLSPAQFLELSNILCQY